MHLTMIPPSLQTEGKLANAMAEGKAAEAAAAALRKRKAWGEELRVLEEIAREARARARAIRRSVLSAVRQDA